MKCFGTNKTWEQDIEDFATYYDEVNEVFVIQIEKSALISLIKEAIQRESEISENGL